MWTFYPVRMVDPLEVGQTGWEHLQMPPQMFCGLWLNQSRAVRDVSLRHSSIVLGFCSRLMSLKAKPASCQVCSGFGFACINFCLGNILIHLCIVCANKTPLPELIQKLDC